MKGSPHLEIENLQAYFYSSAERAFVRAVAGVDLCVTRGETLALIGESGSGKSVTALSALGLLKGDPGIVAGRICLHTDEGPRDFLAGLDRCVTIERTPERPLSISKNGPAWDRQQKRNFVGVRGKEIAAIFQNPRTAFNPYLMVGEQIVENIRLHTPTKLYQEAYDQALYWLERVGLEPAAERFDNFPYGLSGGMCQRAMLAMTLAAEPALLIADEPTTGLDATLRTAILELLAELQRNLGFTLLMISHDLHVVRRLAQRVAVFYNGVIVERGPSLAMLSANDIPKHPYTQALLDAQPVRVSPKPRRLIALQGDVPSPIGEAAGCRFAPRCTHAKGINAKRCEHESPPFFQVSSDHQLACWLYTDSKEVSVRGVDA